MIGTKEVKCSIFLMLDYQPPQFKLSEQLSKVLGVHTESRPKIITSLWQYVKNNKLQDSDEREYINNDKYLQEIFNCPRMKFCEIPQRLQAHLLPPDPIVINYVIDPAKPESKKPMCYDIEVHQDDNVRDLMQNFLLSTQSQQEISALESKIHETVEGINQLKTQRDFFLSYSTNPQKFMNDWLASQAKDLKTMTDSAGNAEEERRSDYYNQTWVQEAVHRYFYRQVQEKRAEL
jgi:SWI/SNF-related matrix-associated actin-dependent regulator of chromatin subfamily D